MTISYNKGGFSGDVAYSARGRVASWFVLSAPDRAVRVRTPAGELLCFVVRQDAVTVPLSTQVYNWVAANLKLGVTLRSD